MPLPLDLDALIPDRVEELLRPCAGGPRCIGCANFRDGAGSALEQLVACLAVADGLRAVGEALAARQSEAWVPPVRHRPGGSGNLEWMVHDTHR